jgi:chromosomal replication initiation ATPase DnaA
VKKVKELWDKNSGEPLTALTPVGVRAMSKKPIPIIGWGYKDIHKIQKEVARMFGLTVHDMLEKDRSKTVVRARALAMYMSRHFTSASLCEIANHFDRHHTTILNAMDSIDSNLKKDTILAEQVKTLKSRFIVKPW